MEYVILDLEWNQPVSKESYPYRSIGDPGWRTRLFRLAPTRSQRIETS